MKISTGIAIACLSVLSVSDAADVTAAVKKNTVIPAQGLAPALQTFSKERDIHLVFISEDVSQIRTNGASGELTVDEALSQLLKGTGLTYRYIDHQTISILPIGSASSKTTAGYSPARGLIVAQAEEADNKAAMEPVDSPAADGAGNGDATKKDNLQEIVVTAQKREERVQDVPIAISVLSGVELDKSTNQGLKDALNTMPGVSATTGVSQNGTRLIVRGVNGGELFSGSNTVGYYLDSVPFGFVRNGLVPDVDIYDLERVEVLRGPQGTLYGANSQNGVVRVLTHPADPTKLEVKGRASASSTKEGGENYRGDFAVNLPIIEDKLAARASLGYQDLSGWIDRPGKEDANDGRIKTGRVRVNYQPTERFSVEASAWLSRAEFGANPVSSADPYTRLGPVDFDESIPIDNDVLGLKLGYDLERFSVAATIGYLDYSSEERVGATYLPPTEFLLTRLESKVLSQEIVFNSIGNQRWRWTAGAMYRDGEDRLLQEFSENSPFLFFIDFGQSSESLAVYGDLTRVFADGRFELSGGLRYYRDEVGDTENQLTSGAALPLISRYDTFDEVSPRLVLTWHPNDELIVYGSYSEGFRSGFNQWALITRTAPDFPSVKPDTIINYEIGAKGGLWDGRIGFDVATYFVDWKDRIQGLLVDYNGVPISTFVNGTGASGIGMEMAITANVTDGFTVAATFSWNDLRAEQDVFIGDSLVLAKDDRLPDSPEYTGGLSARYAFPLGGAGYKGELFGSVNYVGALGAKAHVAGEVQDLLADAMLSTHASFALQSPKSWAMTLYVDNVSDENGFVYQDIFSVDGYTRIRPRTVGLMFDFKY